MIDYGFGNYLVQTLLSGKELRDAMNTGGRFEACSVGMSSGERCGSLLEIGDNGTFVAGFPSEHGDSGGPIFVRTASKGDYVAVIGIQDAVSKTTGNTTGTQIEPILRRFGVMLHAERH